MVYCKRRTRTTNLRESRHVSLNDVWVRTFQLLDDVETLIQLREDVGHRTREQNMLRCFLKLQTSAKTLQIQLQIVPEAHDCTEFNVLLVCFIFNAFSCVL